MDTPDHPHGALTVAEFCRVYKVGRTRFYEIINAGELPARKCGRRTLIAWADAELWFQKLADAARRQAELRALQKKESDGRGAAKQGGI